MRLRSNAGWAVTAAVLIALVAACGSGHRDGAAADPPGSERTATALQDLPFPARTRPFGVASETGGIVAQTFSTSGFTPEAIVEFYDEHLVTAGWTPTQPVDRAPGPRREDFTRGKFRLELSAVAVPNERGTGSEQAIVQFSLVLRPT